MANFRGLRHEELANFLKIWSGDDRFPEDVCSPFKTFLARLDLNPSDGRFSQRQQAVRHVAPSLIQLRALHQLCAIGETTKSRLKTRSLVRAAGRRCLPTSAPKMTVTMAGRSRAERDGAGQDGAHRAALHLLTLIPNGRRTLNSLSHSGECAHSAYPSRTAIPTSPTAGPT